MTAGTRAALVVAPAGSSRLSNVRDRFSAATAASWAALIAP
jgi:hypothetical protein